MGVKFDSGLVLRRVKSIDPKMQAFIYSACRLNARRGVKYARKNAPWTDRTGNARNGLVAGVAKGTNVFAIVFAGTVSYAPYLELRWNGKYQIIRPTVDRTGPEVMKTISTGFARIFGG